jgi:hypothetical protein
MINNSIVFRSSSAAGCTSLPKAPINLSSQRAREWSNLSQAANIYAGRKDLMKHRQFVQTQAVISKPQMAPLA